LVFNRENIPHHIHHEATSYDVIHFVDDGEGGGALTTIGMAYDEAHPPVWILETIDTGRRRRIQITSFDDASIDHLPKSVSKDPKSRNTDCRFYWL
jgi:hypothetical protein